MKTMTNLFLSICLFVLLPLTNVSAETINFNIEHELLLSQPAQSWEHRFDLPDYAIFSGQVFIKRNFRIPPGYRIVIEREEFTSTYYFVKVRIPKEIGEYATGKIEIALEIGKPQPPTAEIAPPTSLGYHPYAPALKPFFFWKGEGKYAAFSLYDLDENKTIMERITQWSYCSYDEGLLPKHRFIWAVKVGDEAGKFSKETQAKFHIGTQNGIVVIIPD